MVNFAAGVTEQVVEIPITNDSIIESTEVFEAVLTTAVTNTIVGNPGVANVFIEDDDGTLPSVTNMSPSSHYL